MTAGRFSGPGSDVDIKTSPAIDVEREVQPRASARKIPAKQLVD
jgi:hypothetical protein